MKITFLGDSIRMQYAPVVKEILGNDFEVWHPSENCRFSKYTLRGLYEWSKAMEGTDIVHWNNGLWDICDLWDDGPFTAEEEYIGNMLRILGVLQKNHKKIIFATTTPVRPENRYDKNVNIERFNEIIVPILKERGVIINDLNGLLKPDVYKYIREDCIHLSEVGIELCANQVAQCIQAAAEDIVSAKTENGQYTEEDTLGLPVLL